MILSYIMVCKIHSKVTCFFSWKRKRDIAVSKGHVIRAELEQKFRTGDPGDYNWHARYKYRQGGEEKLYRALFTHSNILPLYLYLYYINKPKKLFSVNEYHVDHLKGIPLIILNLISWLFAGLTMVLLKAEYGGYN